MFLVAEFHVGKRIQMPSFRECLRERGTVQMLTMSREVAIEVQVHSLKLYDRGFSFVFIRLQATFWTACLRDNFK